MKRQIQARIIRSWAAGADKVVEFDEKPSEIRRSDIGDPTLPAPVDLTDRNPTIIDVPKNQ